MSTSQVTYNTELMEKISAKFNDGYDILDDAITQFGYFKNSFYSNYNGQARVEIFDSITTTMKEHMELLQLCYSNMKEYVNTAKEEMISTDKALSDSMNGSAQKKEGGASGENN